MSCALSLRKLSYFAVSFSLGRTTDYAETEVRQHYTDNQRWPSLASTAAENRLQALHDHLQVLASDCSGVPSRLVRVSLNQRQSPIPAFSCSWWLTSPGNQNCYFRAPQLCFECPKLWNSLPLPLRDSTLTVIGNSAAGWKLICLV